MADPKKKKDPIEQIQDMIDASIKGALGEQQARADEAKDPMKRLQRMIDESVGKHFEAFAKGLDTDEEDEGEEPTEDTPGFLEQLFGGGEKKAARK